MLSSEINFKNITGNETFNAYQQQSNKYIVKQSGITSWINTKFAP